MRRRCWMYRIASATVLICSATSSGMVMSNSSSSSITSSTVSSESAPRSDNDEANRVSKVAVYFSSPSRFRNHQSSCPQLGQHESPVVSEDSMFATFPQRGQRCGTPSGVRDEMVTACNRIKMSTEIIFQGTQEALDCTLPAILETASSDYPLRFQSPP